MMSKMLKLFNPRSLAISRKYLQLLQRVNDCDWIPAFAGMTDTAKCHSSEGWNPVLKMFNEFT